MIRGLFLFLLLFGLQSHARPLVETTPEFAHPSLVTLAEFQQRFLDEGYWSLDAQNTGAARAISVDQIFTTASLNETLFLKLGLKQFPFGSFTRIAGGIAYQGVTYDRIPYVVFFDHVELQRARSLVRSTPFQSLLKFFVPRARASDCAKGSSPLEDLEGFNGFRSLATCAITAMETADQTVTGPLKALAKFVEDPAKFWESTKQDWQKLKAFVLNVRAELVKFYRTMSRLDAEVVAEISCAVIGQVAASAAITALSGGLAASSAALKTSTAIALLTEKIGKLKAVLQAVSEAKQFAKLKTAGTLTRQVMSCASP